MTRAISDLLQDAAEQRPDAPALLAPQRTPLSYGRLWEHTRQVAGALDAIGIGARDRVAIVMPDGPEMASAFLAVSAACACAPLNPKYTANEFEFYLSDLHPKALLLQPGTSSAAASVARSRGIRVIETSPDITAAAGIFHFQGMDLEQESFSICRDGDETSLILHTSGTTSHPKMVPLSQHNLCTSAWNIAGSVSLSVGDRCLNVMPLFHIHGLIGAVLSSLAAGSSVVCTPGFNSIRFFEWLEELQPTWYTAVPTMHQAVLARAIQKPGIHARSSLRFIRSCSSALPPKLMGELEREFRVPVVEAYGMTEASHQIAVNPLPPSVRKPGSVGLAVGCEIAVWDENGAVLPPETVGAVAIRGASITGGYENNPEANESSFRDGWFLTGDQGKRDSEGYLFLAGRTKEIINRGGEKISPREIDEVLLEHPAVVQAMAFAIPDERLGEDVGAAVVVNDATPSKSTSSLEKTLRDFAAGRLAAFKVPRQIVLLPELPKGPTGKLQRIGMAARLGMTGPTPMAFGDVYVPPQSELELQIVKIWEKLLDTRPVGIRNDFFRLGGDSLLATVMLSQLEETCGIGLPVSALLPVATVEKLASALLTAQKDEVRSPIVPIQPYGTQPPFFFHHGQWQGGGLYCRDLVRFLGEDQPFFAIVPHGLDQRPVPRTIPDMAADRIRDLLEVQPDGPIRLGGYCNGALVALEMAQQLRRLGRKVDLLVIVETHAPNIPFRRIFGVVQRASGILRADRETVAQWFLRLRALQMAWSEASKRGLRGVGDLAGRGLRGLAARGLRRRQHTSRAGDATGGGSVSAPQHGDPGSAINCYVPDSYDGPIALLRTVDIGSVTANFTDPNDGSAGWAEIAPQIRIHWLSGNHESIVREDVDEIGRRLAACLADNEARAADNMVTV